MLVAAPIFRFIWIQTKYLKLLLSFIQIKSAQLIYYAKQIMQVALNQAHTINKYTLALIIKRA